jgi:hypothetical protein
MRQEPRFRTGQLATEGSLADELYERWLGRLNRRTSDDQHQEEQGWQQCGASRFRLPLAGQRGYEWGARSKEPWELDGAVRFAHDGGQESD